MCPVNSATSNYLEQGLCCAMTGQGINLSWFIKQTIHHHAHMKPK